MEEKSFSKQIDDIITMQESWKGKVVSQIRAIILEVDPEIIEQVKWKMKTRPEGLPVWSHKGMVCFIEIWKTNLKLLFPKGAYLKDSQKLFNARLKSKDIRAIEFFEHSSIDRQDLKVLIAEAVHYSNSE